MKQIPRVCLILIIGLSIYLVGLLQQNPQFIKDIGQAIADVRLELIITGLLLTLLSWFGIRFNASQSTFQKEISIEMLGAVITTLFLGVLVLIFQQYQAIQGHKAELVLQMDSPDNGFAVEAARQLRAIGWLYDGTLQNAGLVSTNLQGAILSNANFQGANMEAANLQATSLIMANLQDVNLSVANLENAILDKANLQGALLYFANLRGARLWEAELEGAMLPDAVIIDVDDNGDPTFDKYWTRDTDMSRYTDPNHPDFWDPCKIQQTAIVLMYCED